METYTYLLSILGFSMSLNSTIFMSKLYIKYLDITDDKQTQNNNINKKTRNQ